ncbi:MAG TPA: 2-amino-4-hydroxy-6-hydroxymethyldihydropteridine diphosphokinase [Gemmatimonadota bacterium]|nr:2-amino-4-hydroxy-6-hydroxymethyldihydropteridine diphosphokinase [Gemmatimonadota bacterium]
MSRRAYLSLGSNLGDRSARLGAARAALIARTDLRLVALSPVVETDPVDVTDQPRFLNQVLAVDTSLEPRSLLDVCLAIEHGLGRDRNAGPRRGPRTIDIDLLLYGGETLDEPGLTLPHARLAEREFFLALCRAAGAPEVWLPKAVVA